MPPSENPPERILLAFQEEYWDDCDRGEIQPLAHYLAQYPGHEERIAQEFLSLQGKDEEHGFDEQDSPRLGPYDFVKELGRGGQAVVYLAEDRRLHRPVALKILKGLGPASEILMKRFQREAEVASKIDHPGICQVYDAGVDHGVAYIAMRYVEGETLADRVSASRSQELSEEGMSCVSLVEVYDETNVASGSGREPASHTTVSTDSGGTSTKQEIRAVLEVFEKAARALHAAHEAGVVHRDIKPANIMLTKAGQPVILDFGLAGDEESDMASLTQSGDLFGTPAYMSPEQLMAGRIRADRRTDIYSLGVTLYECLTLDRPFQGPTREAMYHAIQTKDAANPRSLNIHIPADLKVVLETSMEKDRDHRYQTALNFAEELRRVREHEPIVARAAGPIRRLHRWAQRHPGVAVALVLLFISLSTGLALTTHLWRQSDEAFQAAETERQRAESGEDAAKRARKAAESASDYMLKLIGNINPAETLNPNPTIKQLLAGASAGIDESALEGEPEASVRTTLGRAFVTLADHDSANDHLKKALEIRRKLWGKKSESFYETLAPLVRVLDPADRDLPNLNRELLEAGFAIIGTHNPELAGLMRELPEKFKASSDLDTMKKTLDQAVLKVRANLEKKQVLIFAESLRAQVVWLGAGESDPGRERREHFLQAALELQKEHLAENHPDLAETRELLAVTLFGQSKVFVSESKDTGISKRERAVELLDQCISTREKVLPEGSWLTALARGRRAAVWTHQGRYAAAEEPLKSAWRRFKEEFGPGHPRTREALAALVILYESWRLDDEVERLCTEPGMWRLPQTGVLFDRLRRHAAAFSRNVQRIGIQIIDKASPSGTLGALRKCQELRKGGALTRTLLKSDYGDTLQRLALMASARGLLEQSVELYRETVAVWQEILPENHGRLGIARARLARALEDLLQFDDQGLQVARKAADTRELMFNENSPQAAQARAIEAGHLIGLGRHEEAEGILIRSWAVLKNANCPRRPKLEVLARLRSVYRAMKNSAVATRFDTELLHMMQDPDAESDREGSLLILSEFPELTRAIHDLTRASWIPPLGPQRRIKADAAEKAWKRMESLMPRAIQMGGPTVELALARILDNLLSRTHTLVGKRYTAIRLAGVRAALASYERHLPEDHVDQALCGIAGVILGDSENYAEAEKQVRHAVEIFTSSQGARHWETGLHRTYLGHYLGKLGRHKEGEADLLAGCDILSRRRGGQFVGNMIVARRQLVEFYKTWGKPRKAADWRAQLNAVLTHRGGRYSDDDVRLIVGPGKTSLIKAIQTFQEGFESRGRLEPDLANRWDRVVAARREELPDDDPDGLGYARFLRWRGEALANHFPPGPPALCLKVFEEAWAIQERLAPVDETAEDLLIWLAIINRRLGKDSETLEKAKRAMKVASELHGRGSWRTAYARALAGAAHTRLGQYDLAEAELLAAWNGILRGPRGSLPTFGHLVELYRRWEDPSQATRMLGPILDNARSVWGDANLLNWMVTSLSKQSWVEPALQEKVERLVKTLQRHKSK